MTVTAASFDDGEDVATVDDGWAAAHAQLLDAVRAIGDPDTRRAVWLLIVLAVLHGRVGR